MSEFRRFFACALGACLCATPAIVVAQHGSEAKASEHAAPAAKPEAAAAKDAGHAVKAEPAKAAEAKPKAEHKAEPTSAKAEPAAHADKGAKPEAGKTASAEKATKPEPKEKGAEPKVEPKDAKRAKADGPRVTVTRVDETTGAARGSGAPAAHSKLEDALERISERIVDGRKEGTRASATKSATRIRLSWRTTLDWPEELSASAPEPQMPEPPAAPEAAPDKDHVALVWE